MNNCVQFLRENMNPATFPGGTFHIALWKYATLPPAPLLELIPGVCIRRYMCACMCALCTGVCCVLCVHMLCCV